MGYDRLGRPILATQYGSLRLWEMTKLTTVDRMTELHAREQELLLRMLRRRTLEGGEGGGDQDGGGGGHIVDTAVVVIDTAGLTLRHVSTAQWRPPTLTPVPKASKPSSIPCLSNGSLGCSLKNGRPALSDWVLLERGVLGERGKGLAVMPCPPFANPPPSS